MPNRPFEASSNSDGEERNPQKGSPSSKRKIRDFAIRKDTYTYTQKSSTDTNKPPSTILAKRLVEKPGLSLEPTPRIVTKLSVQGRVSSQKSGAPEVPSTFDNQHSQTTLPQNIEMMQGRLTEHTPSADYSKASQELSALADLFLTESEESARETESEEPAKKKENLLTHREKPGLAFEPTPRIVTKLSVQRRLTEHTPSADTNSPYSGSEKTVTPKTSEIPSTIRGQQPIPVKGDASLFPGHYLIPKELLNTVTYDGTSSSYHQMNATYREEIDMRIAERVINIFNRTSDLKYHEMNKAQKAEHGRISINILTDIITNGFNLRYDEMDITQKIKFNAETSKILLSTINDGNSVKYHPHIEKRPLLDGIIERTSICYDPEQKLKFMNNAFNRSFNLTYTDETGIRRHSQMDGENKVKVDKEYNDILIDIITDKNNLIYEQISLERKITLNAKAIKILTDVINNPESPLFNQPAKSDGGFIEFLGDKVEHSKFMQFLQENPQAFSVPRIRSRLTGGLIEDD